MFTNQNFLLNQESTIPINIKKPLISIMIHERWKISKNWSHLTPGKMSFDNIMIFTEINKTSNIFDICTTGPIPYCTSWNNWYPQRTLGRGQIIPENFPLTHYPLYSQQTGFWNLHVQNFMLGYAPHTFWDA